jgi:hypothetical protein
MLALLLAAAAALPSAASSPRPPPAPPPELWHGARAGMTPAEVKALFPQARAPIAINPGPPPIANMVDGGGGAGLAVDEVVFGHPAVATYYFAGGHLLSVIVEVQNMQLRHTRDNVDVAREVQVGLADYYGPPKVCVDTDKRGLARLDCRWVVRGAQVGLSYVDYGGLNPSLSVAARQLPAKKRMIPAVFGRRGVH